MDFSFTNLTTGKATRWVNPKPYLLRRDRRGFSFASFFDSDKVIAALDRKTQQDLTGLGFYTRKAIRNSMKSGKSKAKNKALRQSRGIRSSKPGNAPNYITGALRDNILFSYDERNRSLILGPRKLNSKSMASTEAIPKVLNEGGEVYLVEYDWKYTDGTTGNFKRKNAVRIKVGQRTVDIAARPYNGPAAKNWPAILKKWRGLIAKNQLRESQAFAKGV